jgi:hypothetical protein
MSSEDRAAEAVVREMLASLQAKFKLSDAHCKLIAKDIEEIAAEPPERRAQIVGQIEKEIAQSVRRHAQHTMDAAMRPEREKQPSALREANVSRADMLACCTSLCDRSTPSQTWSAAAHSAVSSRGQSSPPRSLARMLARASYDRFAVLIPPFCCSLRARPASVARTASRWPSR